MSWGEWGRSLGLLLPLLRMSGRGGWCWGRWRGPAGVRGGVSAVVRGLSRASWQTVADGAAELESGQDVAEAGRVRRPGGGRKPLTAADPGLEPALLALVEDSTRGAPMSPPVRRSPASRTWSDGQLAAQGPVHRQAAQRLLHANGYSLQANAKTIEGHSGTRTGIAQSATSPRRPGSAWPPGSR